MRTISRIRKQTYFAIKHKPTGSFMPVPKGKGGTGSSYWEPTQDGKLETPRLFITRKAALASAIQWLRGTHTTLFEKEHDDTFGQTYNVCTGTEVELQQGRNKVDLQIVEFNLSAINFIDLE